jgi:hypothetical protein
MFCLDDSDVSMSKAPDRPFRRFGAYAVVANPSTIVKLFGRTSTAFVDSSVGGMPTCPKIRIDLVDAKGVLTASTATGCFTIS